MRSKSALYNLMTSLFIQLFTIISGLIVPRLILLNYGSSVNGLLSSITQFLQYIVLLEGGLGMIVTTAFYKPLAEGNKQTVASIFEASHHFFRRISYFLIGYVLLLAFFYPRMIDTPFDFWYIFWLILIIAISNFANYYFAMSYHLLLSADQKIYISNVTLVLSQILYLIVTVSLIHMSLDIHIVKLGSSLALLLRPLLLFLYGKRYYKINGKDIQKSCVNPIKDRWVGLAQHIATFVNTKTDIVIISFLCNIIEVSVYSLYALIAVSINNLISSLTNSMRGAFGNMLAKNETKSLRNYFSLSQFLYFTAVTITYSTALVVAIPFISIYTQGVTDASYIRPALCFFLFLSQAIYCLQLPYSLLTTGAGHYRQLQTVSIIEPILKITLSIAFVLKFGIVGTAIGTLFAMTFRLIHYIIYVNRNLAPIPTFTICKRFFINIIAGLLTIFIPPLFLTLQVNSFLLWTVNAMIVFSFSFVVTMLFNILLFRSDFKLLIAFIRSFLKRDKAID